MIPKTTKFTFKRKHQCQNKHYHWKKCHDAGCYPLTLSLHDWFVPETDSMVN